MAGFFSRIFDTTLAEEGFEPRETNHIADVTIVENSEVASDGSVGSSKGKTILVQLSGLVAKMADRTTIIVNYDNESKPF